MDEYKKAKVKHNVAWTVAFFFAIIWVAITFIPFFFMVMNAFKGQFEMLTSGVFTLPESLSFANYESVVEGGIFGYMGRSVIVVAISLVALLFLCSCASYPLARMNFRMRPVLFGAIVAAMAVPMHVTLIPVFKMTTNTGLYDSLWALIGPYVTFGLPLSCFIMTNFMKGIPKEIEEAAEIDGCNKYRNFFEIILPLSKAGLSTLAIYNGINYWNEFAFANTLTQSASVQTLPLAMAAFKGEHSMDIPIILAVLVVSVLPMIVMFCILQDKLVKGMMVGAVKG